MAEDLLTMDAEHPVIEVFGVRWRLDASGLDPEVRHNLTHLWRRAIVEDDGVTEVETFRVGPGHTPADGAGVAASTEDEFLPYAVSRAVTMASITRRAGGSLMLHAAGLASPSGATVALVAASGTGKSTASRLLGQQFGYVSDETVIVELDERFSISAHPKPLSIVTDPERRHNKTEVSPDDAGLLVAPDDAHLAALVILDRDPEAERAELVPMGLVEAMTKIIPHSSSLTLLHRPLQTLARAATLGDGPWRMQYAEIADCVPIIEGLLQDPPAVPPQTAVVWRGFDGSVLPESASILQVRDREPPTTEPNDAIVEDAVTVEDGVALEAEQAAEPPWANESELDGLDDSWTVDRTPFRDAVESGGQTLVLVDRIPLVLPGLASVLWTALEEPRTVNDLLASTIEQLGEHPDAREFVLDTVRGLVGHDALRVRAPIST